MASACSRARRTSAPLSSVAADPPVVQVGARLHAARQSLQPGRAAAGARDAITKGEEGGREKEGEGWVGEGSHPGKGATRAGVLIMPTTGRLEPPTTAWLSTSHSLAKVLELIWGSK